MKATPRRAPSSPISKLLRSNTGSTHGSKSSIHNSYRIGIGNDLHRLAPGRKLVLGGVRIPFDRGPVGHSDGDALAHAIADALLGAAALGDIGRHFPNTSAKWRNAPSLTFLRHVRKLLGEAGYSIVNIDATVGLERPKLSSHIPRMRMKVAAALGTRSRQVSIKAKTGEGVDAVGEGAALRADAVALIEAVRQPSARELIRSLHGSLKGEPSLLELLLEERKREKTP